MFTVAQQRLRSGPKIFQPPANSSPWIYVVTLVTGGGGEPSEHPPPSVYVSLQDANGKALKLLRDAGVEDGYFEYDSSEDSDGGIEYRACNRSSETFIHVDVVRLEPKPGDRSS